MKIFRIAYCPAGGIAGQEFIYYHSPRLLAEVGTFFLTLRWNNLCHHHISRKYVDAAIICTGGLDILPETNPKVEGNL